MIRLTSSLLGVVALLPSLVGCALDHTGTGGEGTATPSGGDPAIPSGGAEPMRVAGGDVEVTLSTPTTWPDGYCNSVVLKNRDDDDITWTARIVRDGTIYDAWGSLLREEGNDWVFTGADFNKTLAPAQRADFGYCVTVP